MEYKCPKCDAEKAPREELWPPKLPNRYPGGYKYGPIYTDKNFRQSSRCKDRQIATLQSQLTKCQSNCEALAKRLAEAEGLLDRTVGIIRSNWRTDLLEKDIQRHLHHQLGEYVEVRRKDLEIALIDSEDWEGNDKERIAAMQRLKAALEKETG